MPDTARGPGIDQSSADDNLEADSIGPLNNPDKLIYGEPADIRTADIERSMPRGLSA